MRSAVFSVSNKILPQYLYSFQKTDKAFAYIRLLGCVKFSLLCDNTYSNVRKFLTRPKDVILMKNSSSRKIRHESLQSTGQPTVGRLGIFSHDKEGGKQIAFSIARKVLVPGRMTLARALFMWALWAAGCRRLCLQNSFGCGWKRPVLYHVKRLAHPWLQVIDRDKQEEYDRQPGGRGKPCLCRRRVAFQAMRQSSPAS
jgi:hypothetical protein